MNQPLFTTVTGDLLNAPAGFIVHGCNMQGVMGSGVARGVKGRYPGAYQTYLSALKSGAKLGSISVYSVNRELYIVNALTQDSFGSGLQVSYSAIENAFLAIKEFADIINPDCSIPICFPLIGAGRGGGDWDIIKLRITRHDWKTRVLVLFTVGEEPAYCK